MLGLFATGGGGGFTLVPVAGAEVVLEAGAGLREAVLADGAPLGLGAGGGSGFAGGVCFGVTALAGPSDSWVCDGS